MKLSCVLLGHKYPSDPVPVGGSGPQDHWTTFPDGSSFYVLYYAHICSRCGHREAVPADRDKKAQSDAEINRVMNDARARYGLKPIDFSLAILLATSLTTSLTTPALADHTSFCSANTGIQMSIPDSQHLTCSRLFYVSGVCGTANYSTPGWEDVGWYVNPWETRRTMITSASLDLTLQASPGTPVAIIGGMIGNAYNSDPVIPWKTESRLGTVASMHQDHNFLAGAGSQVPSSNDPRWANSANNAKAHLDIHIMCAPAGAWWWGFVWFQYEPNEGDPQ